MFFEFDDEKISFDANDFSFEILSLREIAILCQDEVAAPKSRIIDIAFEFFCGAGSGFRSRRLHESSKFEGGTFTCFEETYAAFSDLVDSPAAAFLGFPFSLDVTVLFKGMK